MAHSILIVDDDESTRGMLTRLLQSQGYETATAAHGAEAVRRLVDAKPCVILLDFEMPVMDGHDFREVQKSVAPDVPIICLTGAADAELTARQLEIIKALGVGIAIDDFGTGYSSFAYLRQFPVDILKIDRSFVTPIADSSESKVLLHTLVQLGKQLGLKTLAEGIEQHEQFWQLKDEHCDSGQGFIFARPLEVDAVEDFLESLPDPHTQSTHTPS